jgi:glycosyltransferase involved in cell wall biosynthesis
MAHRSAVGGSADKNAETHKSEADGPDVVPDRLIRVLSVSLFNHWDGISKRVLPVAENLRRFGVETAIVAPAGPGRYAGIASRNHRTYQITLRVPREISDIESLKADMAWFASFFGSVLGVRQVIRTESIDIVHVNGLLNLQAAVAAKLTRRKLVWHLISSSYPRVLVWLLMPFVKLMATRIILVANKMKSFYLLSDRALREGQVLIIREPVDTDRFDPSKVSNERVENLKRKFDIPPASKIFGSVGNITPFKGYEYLVEAAHIVQSEVKSEVRFVIMGLPVQTRANYLAKLVNEISRCGLDRKVILGGWVDDLTTFYAMLDLLVLPSIAEGTPLAILEAMSMQVPVVASNVGGVSEQVLHEQTGLLVQSKDSTAIASAIIRLCNDSERQVMGKKAREHVVSAYSLELCVSEHFKLYSSLLRSDNSL